MSAPSVGSAPSYTAGYVGTARAGSIMVQSVPSGAHAAGDVADPAQTLHFAVTGDFSTSATSGFQSAAGAVQIPLTFRPTAPGTRDGALTVSNDAGDSVRIVLVGTGLDPATPTLDPTTLDFQTVMVGQSKTAPVTFVNPARADNPDDEPCTVTPASGGDGFTISPTASQTVPEGGTQVFTITFTPGTNRAHSHSLSFAWQRAGLSGTITLRLDGIGEQHIDVAGAETNTTGSTDSSGVLTQNQRAGWYVPTYESYLSLGQAWSPVSGVTTQPGFSMTTTRHVFMRAAGTTTFQSEQGPVWFQSELGPLYSVSGGNTSLVAMQSVYLGGGGYVGVMAGYAGSPIPEDDSTSYDDGNPARPAPIDKVPLAFTVADWVWSIADKLVNVVNAIYLVKHTIDLGNHVKALGKIACFASTTAQVVGLASFIYGRALGSPKKEANFYSQAGILMGTPAFCSIYGTAGVNYRSANITLLGNIGVAVNSIGATSLDSIYGDTSVASRSVSVCSWDGFFSYATRGKQTVLGWDMTLGGYEPDGMQAPTLTMELESAGSVALSTKTPASKLSLKARATAAWPDPAPALALDAKVTATLEAPTTTIRLFKVAGAPAWTIEASAAGISIKGTSGEVLKVEDGVVTLGPTGTQIKVGGGSTTVGTGTMTIASSAITVNGFANIL